jgi:hypothetical protein
MAHVEFKTRMADMTDLYKRDLSRGMVLAMIDQMEKHQETLDQGMPLYLMVKLVKDSSSRHMGDDWQMNVVRAAPHQWDAVAGPGKTDEVRHLLYHLRSMKKEDVKTIMEQMVGSWSVSEMREFAKLWGNPQGNRKDSGDVKLFEVFIVRKDSKEVSRSLAWGKDPQAIREKALLDAGITSKEYDESQVVVKFVAAFDFPEDGEEYEE